MIYNIKINYLKENVMAKKIVKYYIDGLVIKKLYFTESTIQLIENDTHTLKNLFR